MAEPTTQQRNTEAGSGERGAGAGGPRRGKGVASLVAGAAGIVAAILPGLGILALALAAVAIGTGVPAMRQGPGARCFPHARIGVVLGMIAVLLGFLSLAVQLL